MARLYFAISILLISSTTIFGQAVNLEHDYSKIVGMDEDTFYGRIAAEITRVQYNRRGLEIYTNFNSLGSSCHQGPVDLDFEFIINGQINNVVNKYDTIREELVESYFISSDKTLEDFAIENDLDYIASSTQDGAGTGMPFVVNEGKVTSGNGRFIYNYEYFSNTISTDLLTSNFEGERKQTLRFYIQKELSNLRFKYGDNLSASLSLPIKNYGGDSYDIRITGGRILMYPWSESRSGGTVDYFHPDAYPNGRSDLSRNLNTYEVSAREAFFKCQQEKKGEWYDYTFGERIYSQFNSFFEEDIDYAIQRSVNEEKSLVIFVYNHESNNTDLKRVQDDLQNRRENRHPLFRSPFLAQKFYDNLILTSISDKQAVESNILTSNVTSTLMNLDGVGMDYIVIALMFDDNQVSKRHNYTGIRLSTGTFNNNVDDVRSHILTQLTNHGYISK